MTNTTLSRSDVSKGFIAEYEGFAALIEPLTAAEWDAPTRCTGFAVRDVAGHVIGLAEDTAAGVPGSRNAEEEAASVRHESPAGAAARLRAAAATVQALLDALDADAWNGPSPVPELTLAQGVLTLWYDAYVHADDVRAALGRPTDRGPGLDASVAYLAHQLETRGWGPATLALEGMPRYDVGAGGREVRGDPVAFVLVATGRLDPSVLALDRAVNIYAD